MIHQLRTYTIQPGAMEDWVELFETHIRPVNGRLGMHIIGTWVNHEHNEFIWLRRFSSEDEIEEMEAAYFASPERQALGDRPQQLIQHMDIIRSTCCKCTSSLTVIFRLEHSKYYKVMNI